MFHRPGTRIALVLVLLAGTAAAESVYETDAEFVTRAFGDASPEARILWLAGDLKSDVHALLGHDYPALRLRYWCRAQRSAWILEEIGKELPITVGIIVQEGHIESLNVMVYRENRGGEVANAAFMDQFAGVGRGGRNGLDRQFDGITGATLSVQALTRLAAVALRLDAEAVCSDAP